MAVRPPLSSWVWGEFVFEATLRGIFGGLRNRTTMVRLTSASPRVTRNTCPTLGLSRYRTHEEGNQKKHMNVVEVRLGHRASPEWRRSVSQLSCVTSHIS